MRELTKRRKIIVRLSIIIVIFLIVCTLISNGVYHLLLPVVETVYPESKALGYQTDVKGTLTYSNGRELYAKGNWTVETLDIPEGHVLKEGEPVLTVRSDTFSQGEEELRLSLLQAQQQLATQTLTESGRRSLELQLKIAEEELDLYKNNPNSSGNDISILQAEQDLINAQAALDAGELTAQAALEELAQYRAKGVGFDYSVAKRLRTQLLQIGTQLNNSTLTEEKRTELQLKMEDLESELDLLYSQYDGYDPIQEQQLRIKALQAMSKIDESEYGSSALEIQLEIAKLQLQSLSGEVSHKGEELELSILKLKESLENNSGTPGYQAAQLQVKMAQEKLDNYKNIYPADGKVYYDEAGVIASWLIQPGDRVTEGDLIANIIDSETISCVQWSMAMDEGNRYQIGDTIVASLMLPSNTGAWGTSQVSGKVSEKSWSYKDQMWLYTADLPGYENYIMQNMTLAVTVSHSDKSYPYVVPLSCVQNDPTSGDYYVYCVESREGLFSQEFYVTQKKVLLIAQDSLYAAIEGEIANNTEIVYHASKAIYNKAVISIVE